jgi:hypothetical protein
MGEKSPNLVTLATVSVTKKNVLKLFRPECTVWVKQPRPTAFQPCLSARRGRRHPGVDVINLSAVFSDEPEK